MAYLVLARKYRPQTFDDVVGQGEIANTLKRSIESDRVAHAYLFCGPRGVGKTSLARIFSKALNCPEAKDGVPCTECAICQDIAAGSDVDVLEIDGASNRGIDEVRGIREGAKYMPARGRYKIYIIDEVHMLTGPAFNALLKTLEEPPPHVIFLFATTHPQALPDTVRSRCQRFDFRAIERGDIVERLEQICTAESVTAESEALGLIADLAEGGMRDAQSLLDQMIAYSQGDVKREDVERMLGLPSATLCLDLVDAMAAGDAGRAVEAADRAIANGSSPEDLADRMQRLARDLLIVATVDDPVDLPLLSGTARQALAEKRDVLPADAFSYLAKLFGEAGASMRNPGPSRIPLELALIRGARLVDYLPMDEVIAALRSGTVPGPATGGATASSKPAPRAKAPTSAKPAAARPTPAANAPAERAPAAAPPKRGPAAARDATPPRADARPIERPAPDVAPDVAPQVAPATDGAAVRAPAPAPAAAPAPPVAAVTRAAGGWDAVLAAIKEAKPSLGSFLVQADAPSTDGSLITVVLPQRNRFGKQRLQDNKKALQDVASGVLGRAVEFAFELGDVQVERSEEEIRRGPSGLEEGVQRVIEIFEGREVPPRDGGAAPSPEPYGDEPGA